MNDLRSSVRATIALIRAEKAWLEKTEASLVAILGTPSLREQRTPRQANGKRRRAPKGALDNAILTALSSGPMSNAELREHIKKSGYIYSLAPEIVRQACHKLKKEKPPKIKATGEGQGMKYSLAK